MGKIGEALLPGEARRKIDGYAAPTGLAKVMREIDRYNARCCRLASAGEDVGVAVRNAYNATVLAHSGRLSLRWHRCALAIKLLLVPPTMC